MEFRAVVGVVLEDVSADTEFRSSVSDREIDEGDKDVDGVAIQLLLLAQVDPVLMVDLSVASGQREHAANVGKFDVLAEAGVDNGYPRGVS